MSVRFSKQAGCGAVSAVPGFGLDVDHLTLHRGGTQTIQSSATSWLPSVEAIASWDTSALSRPARELSVRHRDAICAGSRAKGDIWRPTDLLAAFRQVGFNPSLRRVASLCGGTRMTVCLNDLEPDLPGAALYGRGLLEEHLYRAVVTAVTWMRGG
jgi:hypothetical protein